jgi:tyrosine-protein kinase
VSTIDGGNVSPPSLLGFLKRWWLLLLLGPLVAGAAGYLVLGRVAPVYQANTTLLVTRGATSDNPVADDPAGAESLARTYAEALKTRPVLEQAAQRAGRAYVLRELQQVVNVRTVTGTQLLRLTVDDPDPVYAAELANAVVAVFAEHNLEMQAGRFASSRQNLEQLVTTLRGELDTRSAQLQQQRATLPAGDPQLARLESDIAQLQGTYSDSVRAYESLRVAEARGLNGLTVVEPAIPPLEPIRPNKVQVLALAILAGVLIAAGIARAIDYLDDGLGSRERLALATGLRALGLIPRWKVGANGEVATQATDQAADISTRRAAEGYRLLFSTLMLAHSDDDQPPRTLMVTSAAMDEGKSVTAANLAAVLAETGRRVILVDADLHRPSQMRRFGLRNRGGLSTLLINPRVAPGSQLRATRIGGLRVLTAGPVPPVVSALFTSGRLVARLNELRELCDVLVVDTPPVLAQPDAALLGPHVDGVLFVVDAQRSRGRQVRRALEQLNAAGATVFGAALNRVSVKTMDYVQYLTYVAGPAPASDANATPIKAVGAAARGEVT